MSRRISNAARLLLTLSLHSAPSTSVAEDKIDYALQIERSADSLDELLHPDERAIGSINGRGRARPSKLKLLDRASLIAPLAFMLNMPKEMLAKAFIEQKYSLSEILFARHLADHKAQAFESVLKEKPRSEWLKELQAARIPLKRVLENFDYVYAEVAFRALNQRLDSAKK